MFLKADQITAASGRGGRHGVAWVEADQAEEVAEEEVTALLVPVADNDAADYDDGDDDGEVIDVSTFELEDGEHATSRCELDHAVSHGSANTSHSQPNLPRNSHTPFLYTNSLATNSLFLSSLAH